MTFQELQEALGRQLNPASWSQHPNGGGWVEATARVDPTATVSGIVSDNARVYEGAHVSGNAWVYGDARVYGTAWVYEGARVYGDARVFGTARVYGNARVSGTAQVSGTARVYGDAWHFSPLQIRGTRHFVTTCDHSHLQIGCLIRTIEKWREGFESTGRRQGYTPDEIAEYGLIINLAADWLNLKFPKEQP